MVSSDDFKITPYDVEGSIDYELIAKRFGVKLIDKRLKQRIKRYAGELHFMIRRGIYYAQRDMDWLLDEYEKGNKFYLYTGIAPSRNMTVGHLIPFMLTQWLQKRFGAYVYIQIPDEEKYLAKKTADLTLDKTHQLSYDDALDIVSLGFDPKKTRVFLDTEYAGTLYKQAVRVSKHITFSMIKDAFGFTTEDNIGKIFYTSMQAAPAFLRSVELGKNVPCLIPLAIDQDVHFRIARDSIAKLGYYKPASIQAKFLPALSGSPKMSSSTGNKNDTIYLNDTEDDIREKVHSAFTGQQATAELQKRYGGDPEKCVVCQYYKFLFEPDDKKLERIFEAERSGSLLAGEHKDDLAETIIRFIKDHNLQKDKYRSKLDKYMVKD